MKGFLFFVGYFALFQLSIAVGPFTISLDGITQVPITSITNFPQSDAVTSCKNNCTSMVNTISSCDSSNSTCFCTHDLQLAMQDCEQCMFNFLVAKNIKAPSPIVGSNPALAGLLSSCTTANITLPITVALSLAPNWNGPVGVELSLGATVVVVGTGALMGISAIYILFNIS